MIYLKIGLRNITFMIKSIKFQTVIFLPLFEEKITVKYGPLLTDKRLEKKKG